MNRAPLLPRKDALRSGGVRLARDESGGAALIVALSLTVLVAGAGIAVDSLRAFNLRNTLQNAADAASLAGAVEIGSGNPAAVADRFFRANLRNVADRDSVSATYVLPTDETLRVDATGRLKTTLMSMFKPYVDVAVRSTAFKRQTARTCSINVINFSADAWDLNEIIWYVVPKDGSKPKLEDDHIILSNDPKDKRTSTSQSIEVPAGGSVEFALRNKTGGVRGYGRNGYGKAQGTVTTYYSHEKPENVRLSTKSGLTRQAWDDNGGGTDDNDYNDAVFEFSCDGGGAGEAVVRLVE